MRQITKHYIFPILFFKRICDVYDEEFADAMESIGDAELPKGKMFHRIQIPENCHWRDVFAETKGHRSGFKKSFRGIELANPKLHGILAMPAGPIKNAFLMSYWLRYSITSIKVNLGVSGVRDDDMGRAYEYLIKRFADKANRNRWVLHPPNYRSFDG